jgi:FAD/FMN-containing dehydrogenase
MLNDAAIARFQENLHGDFIQSNAPGFEEARKVFNGMIDKRPALIVRCAAVEDVIAAVKLARETNIPAAVRGGGHGVTGNALCDDGLVIDLSAMKSVRVDPGNRTAFAEGGTTWGDFDRETQAFGLATTGGIVPSTGVGGLTLGGGIGYLNRKYGLACDNLLSVGVVNADGQLLKANAEENADLFWGLRGGGGNFGVITSFEYQIHPVGPVLAGQVIYPLDQAKEVLRFYRDWSAAAPDEVRADATLLSGPEGPVLDVILCYCGSIDKGEIALRPMRSCGSPLATLLPLSPMRQSRTC